MMGFGWGAYANLYNNKGAVQKLLNTLGREGGMVKCYEGNILVESRIGSRKEAFNPLSRR